MQSTTAICSLLGFASLVSESAPFIPESPPTAEDFFVDAIAFYIIADTSIVIFLNVKQGRKKFTWF
jgi:hypothetical protein